MKRFNKGEIVYYIHIDGTYRGKYSILGQHRGGLNLYLLLPMDEIAQEHARRFGATIHTRTIDRFERRYDRNLTDFVGKSVFTKSGTRLNTEVNYSIEELLMKLNNESSI